MPTLLTNLQSESRRKEIYLTQIEVVKKKVKESVYG